MAANTASAKPGRVHWAWWVALATGLVLVVVGTTTGPPDLLTDPLRQRFGWSPGLIGAAFAVNIALYGLTAPFAAALMDRFGLRRVVAAALALLAVGAAATTVMTAPWELVVGWGVLVGLGTGSLALTFAAVVANRWFVARRGLVSGVLTSASMFGGMVLLPALAWLLGRFGWRMSVLAVVLAAVALIPVAGLLLRDHPAIRGCRPMAATNSWRSRWRPGERRGGRWRCWAGRRGRAGGVRLGQRGAPTRRGRGRVSRWRGARRVRFLHRRLVRGRRAVRDRDGVVAVAQARRRAARVPGPGATQGD